MVNKTILKKNYVQNTFFGFRNYGMELQKIKIAVLSFLLGIAAVLPAFSYSIAKKDMTPNMLLMVMDEELGKSAFFDDDGDLIIESGGIFFLIQVDRERAFIKFSSQWRAQDGISEAKAYKIVNDWNSDTVFATAFLWKERFRLEYFVSFEGGLSAENFNDTLHWLFSVASAFDEHLRSEGVI